MLTGFFAAVGRHRRIILGVGLILAAGYLVVHAWMPTLGQRAFPAMVAAYGVLLLLAVVALAGRRPNAFLVRPDVPAFSTAPRPVFVFTALAFLLLGTGMVGNVIRDWGSDPFLSDQLPGLGWGAIALLHVALAWRDTSVQLRPEGLWQRGITGWLIIPWDASPTVPTLPPPPNAGTVRLNFGRPELVRRQGLHAYRDRVRTFDIEPWLVTAAIRYYVTHPEHRPAIGTSAEYDRLRSQFHDPFRPVAA